MEKKRLEPQPYSVVTPGEHIEIVLFDIKNFAKDFSETVGPSNAVLFHGNIHPDTNDFLEACVTAEHHEGFHRLKSAIAPKLDAERADTEAIAHGLEHGLTDDNHEPLYQSRSDGMVIEKPDQTIITYTFAENVTVACQIVNGTILIEMVLSDDVINESFNPRVVEHAIQWLSRVTVAGIDTMTKEYTGQHAAIEKNSITVALPRQTQSQLATVPSHYSTELVPIEPRRPDASALDNLGGMNTVKQQLKQRAELFNSRNDEEAKEFSIIPNMPILLHGPPGTGKTSVAKAFADTIGAEIESVDVTSLIGRLIGESAYNTKMMFENAKRASQFAPTLLFLDEFDSFSKRRSNLHDEYEKAVNVFKVEIDSVIQSFPNLFIVAASNSEADEHDEALIRAGRMELIAVGTPESVHELADIWLIAFDRSKHAKPLSDADFTSVDQPASGPDIFSLAEASQGMTGAIIEQIVSGFLMQSYLHKKQSGLPLQPTYELYLKHIADYRKRHPEQFTT